MTNSEKKEVRLCDLSLEDIELSSMKYDHQSSEEESHNSIVFKVLKTFGALARKNSSPVFALIDWGGNIKYDLRRWDEKMSLPQKGMTFSKDELQLLLNKVHDINIDDFGKKVSAKYVFKNQEAIIYERICVLSSRAEWNKEINVVDWGKGTRVDIRKWTKDYCKCSKGITLSSNEFLFFIQLVRKAISI